MKEYAKHDYHAETDKNGDEKVGSSCRSYSATVAAIGVATSIQGTFRNVGVASTHKTVACRAGAVGSAVFVPN